MPELHKLTPSLASLQSRGFQVALVTDGRMSGASGSVPAAIHVTPEALCGGALGKVRDGDLIRLDCHAGVLEAKVAEEIWRQRDVPDFDLAHSEYGCGRELFASLRRAAGDAESGAVSLM
jgi:phosphogluconate dehydratase